MEVIEELKKQNEELQKTNAELLQRIEFLQKPFDFDQSIVVELEVEDNDNSVPKAKIVRLNNYEFINGFMYHSLISRHFSEISESMQLRMVANRMANAIEKAVEDNCPPPPQNMIDSLADWNNIILNK